VKKHVGILLFLLNFSLIAEINDNCNEKATTQLEMNKCIGFNYQTVKNELDTIVANIKLTYKNDLLFLEKFKKSQDAWLLQFKLDLEMKYPFEDKQRQYGSVYSVCSSEYKIKLVKARIYFLKEWLQNSSEGDVCIGSVKFN
jgi:uncharacterized protein YecT (DUF1311 family)